MLITNASRLGDFFVIFFLRAEDCAEDCAERLVISDEVLIGLIFLLRVLRRIGLDHKNHWL